jgi:hypothetical protein
LLTRNKAQQTWQKKGTEDKERAESKVLGICCPFGPWTPKGRLLAWSRALIEALVPLVSCQESHLTSSVLADNNHTSKDTKAIA